MRNRADVTQNREVRKERDKGTDECQRENTEQRENRDPKWSKEKNKEGAQDTWLNLHNLNVDNGIINKGQAYF